MCATFRSHLLGLELTMGTREVVASPIFVKRKHDYTEKHRKMKMKKAGRVENTKSHEACYTQHEKRFA